MNIYGERISEKFNDMNGIINYDWSDAPGPPCLILLHPTAEQDISDLYDNHKDAVNNRQTVVLVLSTSVFAPPAGADPNFFHCLSYEIHTPCSDSLIVERFNELIRKVRELPDWSGVDMRSLWEIVDPPYPEYLVAWYLLLVARDQGVTITELQDLVSQAKKEFEMLCAAHDMTGTIFDRSGIATLFSKAG